MILYVVIRLTNNFTNPHTILIENYMKKKLQGKLNCNNLISFYK